MQEHIHQTHAAGIGDDLIAVEGFVFQEGLLRLVQLVVIWVSQKIIGRQKKTTGTTSRVSNGFFWLRTHALRPRGKVLTGTGLGILSILLQQAFVDIPFHVRTHGGPLGAVHHIDQPVELGRILDFVLRFGEYLAEHTFLGAQRTQQLHIQNFEFGTFLVFQTLPAVLLGNAHIAIVGRFGILIRHFQEDQIGELFQIIAIAHPIVAQGGTETPDFGDDRGSAHGFFSC